MQLIHSILCGLLVVTSLLAAFSINPVESVLFLIITFCFGGALLFMLNIDFLALLYIVVYVGAVAILFLFVIMMINVKVKNSLIEILFSGKYKAFMFVVASIVPFGLLLNILTNHSYDMQNNGSTATIDIFNNIDVFGQWFYNTNYTVALLVAGLLLLLALIGCIVISKDQSTSNRKHA